MLQKYMPLLLFIFGFGLSAQEKESAFLKESPKFYLKAYGVVNYYSFDWDTDLTRQNAFDKERLNLYLYYDFTEFYMMDGQKT